MSSRFVELEDGWVDLTTSEVHRDPPSSLTPMEFKLFAYMAQHRGRLVSWTEIRDRVWHYHPTVRTRTYMATTHRLRKKIELDPAEPRLLVTVRGRGLLFEEIEPPVDLASLHRELRALRNLVERFMESASAPQGSQRRGARGGSASGPRPLLRGGVPPRGD